MYIHICETYIYMYIYKPRVNKLYTKITTIYIFHSTHIFKYNLFFVQRLVLPTSRCAFSQPTSKRSSLSPRGRTGEPRWRSPTWWPSSPTLPPAAAGSTQSASVTTEQGWYFFTTRVLYKKEVKTTSSIYFL